jgi:hypothetical protein
MIKKIILIFFLLFLFSCGKKGDPEYKNPEKKQNKLSLKIRLNEIY